jgi:hypothetical protein
LLLSYFLSASFKKHLDVVVWVVMIVANLVRRWVWVTAERFSYAEIAKEFTLTIWLVGVIV